MFPDTETHPTVGRYRACLTGDRFADDNGSVVRVRLLGPVDVTVDGEVRLISGLRRKAVLATLALFGGEIVSTSQLVEAVWGETAPPDWAGVAAESDTGIALIEAAQAPGSSEPAPQLSHVMWDRPAFAV